MGGWMAGWVGSWVDGRVGLVGLKAARNRFFWRQPFPKGTATGGPEPQELFSLHSICSVSGFCTQYSQFLKVQYTVGKQWNDKNVVSVAPGAVGSIKQVFWRLPGAAGSTKIMVWRFPGAAGSTKILVWRFQEPLD